MALVRALHLRRQLSLIVPGILALITCAVVLLPTRLRGAVSLHSDPGLDRMAIVVDHVPGEDGCRGVAIVDVDDRSVLFRGPAQPHSISRIAVDDSNAQVVGSPGAGNSAALTRWSKEGGDWGSWRHQTVRETREDPSLVTWSGASFVPGTRTLLLGISRPYQRVGAFDLSGIDSTSELVDLPPAVKYGSARSDHPAKIIVSKDGSVAHLVGWRGTVSTLEVSSLVPAAKPVAHAPAVPDPQLAGALASYGYTSTAQIVFADISPDGRFIAINRWAEPELSIVDLHERKSWTVPAGEGITMTGGVSFNHGWENPGLLAVNALHSLVVYRFEADGTIHELSRHPVHPLDHLMNRKWDVAPGNVAWSASGKQLIATTNHGVNDFALVEVSDCGESLAQVAELSVCPNEYNLGREIWTANKRLEPPSDYVATCPTAALHPTATPPRTPAPSPTPIATAVSAKSSGAELETKVIVLEGSQGANSRGCGGLSYFGVNDGSSRLRSSGLENPGSVAFDAGGGTVVVGPSTDTDSTYRVFQDRFDKLFPGSLWRMAVVTSPVGAPIPFGAMSWVWADTQVLLTYRDAQTDDVSIGLFERFSTEGPAPTTPLASVVVPRGVPSDFVLDRYHGEDAMMLWGGTAWVVTDLGEVWRLTIREMSEMEIEGPIADLGPPVGIEGDQGPVARRVHAELSNDQRYLMINRWGDGALHVVELDTGAVRRHTLGDAVAVTGQIATNHGWENNGLVAVHAGDAVVVLYQDQVDGTLTELHRTRIPPPRNESGTMVPGYVAWGTNGLSLIATIDEGLDEFAVFWVRGCGTDLQEMYRVASCENASVRNRGRDIITMNRFYRHSEDYDPICPGGVVPPTVTPSPTAGNGFSITLPIADRPGRE